MTESKRKLTDNEIGNIVSFIPLSQGLPIDVAKNLQERQINDHIKQLRSISIYPSKIPILKERLKEEYYRSLVPAGKSSGAIASSSIGERNTQQSLSSFHMAGQNKVELTTGVPRTEELLNVTRDIKTPCMEISLLEGNDNLEYVKQVAQELFEYKEIIELIDDYEIIKDRKLTEQEKKWYEFYKIYYHQEYEECEYSVRLVFNKTLLYMHKKTLKHISETIEELYCDAYCVFSPDNIGIIDVYVRTDNIGDIDTIIKTLKASKKKSKRKDDDEDDIYLFITDDNKDYIFIRDLVLPSLLYIQIGGIENIKKCYFQKDEKNNWIITTKGSNLKEVIKHPMINTMKVTSNHLWDIYETFGIQAVKNFLKSEFQKLLPVSDRHIQLLVYAMTYSGKPQAVTRYGIDRKHVGPIAKISFEQPFDNFFHSAALAEREDMKGNSSTITMGRLPPMGSGYMSLLDAHDHSVIKDDKMIYDNQIRLQKESQKFREHMMKNNRIPIPRLPCSSISCSNISSQKSLETIPENKLLQKKKSSINDKMKIKTFKPTIPQAMAQNKSDCNNTVTRIIMNKNKIPSVNKPIINNPTIVFESEDGEAVERPVNGNEEEVYY